MGSLARSRVLLQHRSTLTEISESINQPQLYRLSWKRVWGRYLG